MVPEQPGDAATRLRKDGTSLARGMVEMIAALDRKRGKIGNQVVRVEHVTVQPGGQAIVGNARPVSREEDQRVKQGKKPIYRLPDWRTTLPLAQASPRCGAKTRNGSPCRSPAMPNGRCRMHGGRSTGPRTPEGLERVRAARTKHGNYGADAQLLRALVRALKAGVTQIEKLG